MTGTKYLAVLLALGTILATLASANGCINDASRAWFSMGRDNFLPTWFGAIHPRYRTPFRAILFLIPLGISFAILPVLLNKPELLSTVITFSILSALLMYSFMVPNMYRFRKLWPIGTLHRGYTHPFHPLPALSLALIAALVMFATFLGYGTTLLHARRLLPAGIRLVRAVPVQVRAAGAAVHDAVAAAEGVLTSPRSPSDSPWSPSRSWRGSRPGT